VAYSSVCHIGLGLAGLFRFSSYGLVGGVYILIGHGFCSSCLFYLLYIFYERYHTRRGLLLKGLGRMAPSFMFFWFLFSVLNIGVPPSFPFFSEISILAGVLFGNVLSGFLVSFFLFFGGVYGIYFYVISCHGSEVLAGLSHQVTLREYLNRFGHLFPLFFIPLFVNFFYF